LNGQAPTGALKSFDADKLKEDGGGVITGLIKIIDTSDDLEGVYMAFLALREATSQPFRMFDLDSVHEWCSQNTSECKK
jgi:hypothetical protein